MGNKIREALFEAVERGFGDDDSMSVCVERLEQRFMAEYPRSVWAYIYAEVMILAVCQVSYGVSVGRDLMWSFVCMNELFKVDPGNLIDSRDVLQHLQSIDQTIYGEIVSETDSGTVNALSIDVSVRDRAVFAACKAFTDGRLVAPTGIT